MRAWGYTGNYESERMVHCPQCGGEFDRYRVTGANCDDGTWCCSKECRDIMEDGNYELRRWSINIVESPAFFEAVDGAASEHRGRSAFIAGVLREWLEENGYLEPWE